MLFEPIDLSNQALISKANSYSLFIEFNNECICCVKLTKEFAVTALHCIPDEFRVLGKHVLLQDHGGKEHRAQIHSMNSLSDYAVFKKEEGHFDNVPNIIVPNILDQYIAVGSSFGELKLSYRIGHVSTISNGTNGFIYGTSGGLPGYSGGGIYHVRTGNLIGITRGNQYEGKGTHTYGDILEIISAQVIYRDIEMFGQFNI